jgi:hypothetical protein
MQAKMAQQGKHMRVGAREGFAYHSVELSLLANGKRYEVNFNPSFFIKRKNPLSIRVLPCLNADLFDTYSCM